MAGENEEVIGWWFKARRSLIKGFLKKYSKGGILLDVGCGCGNTILDIGPEFECHGIEADCSKVANAKKKGLDVLLSTAETFRFEKKANVVLLMDVLEHIDNDSVALFNTLKNTKKGGLVIITAPANKFLWSHHDVLMKHKRRYSGGQLVKILEKNGLEIIFSSYWNMVLLPVIFIFRKFDKKSRKQSPSPFSVILRRILDFESLLLLNGLKLPFGVTEVLVARKS